MGKPTIYLGKYKDTDQLRGKREADQRLCFCYTDSTIPLLFFLNPKFQATRLLLSLYRLVCVRPGRNPNCWFSHAQAQFRIELFQFLFMYFFHLNKNFRQNGDV